MSVFIALWIKWLSEPTEKSQVLNSYVMSLFSELIAEYNIKQIKQIQDRYLKDETLSDEKKEIVKKLIAEIICVVSD